MSRWPIAAALCVVLVASVAPRAAEKADLTGIYAVDGTNPDGSQYSAVAEIAAKGKVWFLTWSHQRGSVVGVGILNGDVLSVIYSPSTGGAVGLASYAVKGDTLSGTWTIPSPEESEIGTEVLTKTKAKPNPSPAARGPRLRV